MRTRMRLIIVLLLAIWTARAIKAQITSNPIPEPIVKRGIAVEIKDLVRLPLPDRPQQPASDLCERRRDISERRLQPAGERIDRVRLSSGVRAKRLVLHRARGARSR